VRGCAWVCVGVHGYAWVYVGARRENNCVRVRMLVCRSMVQVCAEGVKGSSDVTLPQATSERYKARLLSSIGPEHIHAT
jgi:hypothetical protein